MWCVTTVEDAEDKSSGRIASIRGAGAAVGCLEAVVGSRQQFCFWLPVSGCVWLVHCQAPRPSWDSSANTNACVAHHRAVTAVTATLQANAAVTIIKRDCRVNDLFGLGPETPWKYQLSCLRRTRNSRVVQELQVSVPFLLPASSKKQGGVSSVLSLKPTLLQPLCVPLISGKPVISLIYLKVKGR